VVREWGMSFNISKNKIISFNSVGDTPSYTLNGSVLNYVDFTKYLAVPLQSDCMINKHISKKILDTRRHAYWAPE